MDTVPVAGGEMYTMWGWSCGHKGCRTSYRHRNESVVRGLAKSHEAEYHPVLEGQMTLDESITDEVAVGT